MIEVAGDAVALFASDMHLGDHDPRTADQFLALLNEFGGDATDLFLLGDLFEAWIGDDGADRASMRLIEALALGSARGVQIRVMRGNRDFLLGAAGGPGGFEVCTGARLIDDPTVVSLFGEPVLLSHGDALCTDDLEYQQVRAQLRSVAWQRRFLAAPLAQRREIAVDMRARSEAAKGGKSPQIMDVNARALRSLLAQVGVRKMIHGHTHRPACHGQHDGSPCRWVLPDWDGAAGRGGFLRVDRHGWQPIGPWASSVTRPSD